MSELIDILDRKFYASTVEQAIERCCTKKKCALVIDEKFFDEFLSQSKGVAEESINQIIIISENLNAIYPLFKNKRVLLISAVNFEEAIRILVLGAKLSSDVVYVFDQDKVELLSVVS